MASKKNSLQDLMPSPAKFVKPAELFKARFDTSSSTPSYIEPQSPLKCLNNLTDPSPTKKLPNLLRNPFNKPVKRKLNLGYSPRKDGGASAKSSPNKRTRMLGIDEDANQEPPKSSLSSRSIKITDECSKNNWTLRTKIKVNFANECKNWNQSSNTIHRRLSGVALIDESPSKLNDKTISIEAIKNVSKVYQHPYLSWLPLYPRLSTEFTDGKKGLLISSADSQAADMLHRDWCESFDDLLNLLIDGRCPYFYMCSDYHNILFKTTPSSNVRRPTPQAYISPFSVSMGCAFNKIGIEFKCPEITRNDSSTTLSSLVNENSQASFISSATRTTINLDDDSTQDSKFGSKPRQTASIDSGNYSNLEDEFEDFENDDEDATQILENLGVAKQMSSTLKTKRKGYVETDTNTQTKSTNNKPMAVIEGHSNVTKLVRFLQSNRTHTMTNLGKFAYIPPTLLSPSEFRLSTPQYPEVILSKNMIVPSKQSGQKFGANHYLTPKKNDQAKNQSSSTSSYRGPTFVELRGTILPNIYTELHKLLATSDNLDHSCKSTPLDSSIPFDTISH